MDENAAIENLVRGSMYRLLSQCFARPALELSRRIGDGTLLRALEESLTPSHDNQAVALALRDLVLFEARMEALGTDEERRLAMEVAYNRLFVGPGHVAAPPYESAYGAAAPVPAPDQELSEENTTDGRKSLQVRKAYRAAGFELAGDYHDLPDHLSVELGFVAQLLLEGRGAEDGRTADAFVADHLAAWLPAFVERLERDGADDFYLPLARIANELAQWDAADAADGGGAVV